MPQWNPNGPRRWPGQQPYPHRCSECDEWFDAVAPHAHLCSNRCAQRAHRRRNGQAAQPIPDELECPGCGEWFEPVSARSAVCSTRCKQRVNRRRKREEARERVTA